MTCQATVHHLLSGYKDLTFNEKHRKSIQLYGLEIYRNYTNALAEWKKKNIQMPNLDMNIAVIRRQNKLESHPKN